MSDVASKSEQLIGYVRSLGSCLVAFSGGVDSTVVAKAAQLALGDRAVAVTGTSPSLAGGELEEARSLAERIGIRHVVVSTHEFANPNYTRNAADRCYHCKTDLYSHLSRLAAEWGMAFVVNGANADDAGDYRPGERASAEHQVRSPLAECGFGKQDARSLAAHWQLPVWNKPASPCLASRIAYGEEVTPERLAMVDLAEQYLRQLGLREVRVRYHRGDLARIEVPPSALAALCAPESRHSLVRAFRALGFKFVSVDLEGFRSGSLNEIIPLESRVARIPATKADGDG